MEGVGARLGRSSTRYGPTTVFSGPVRKWKKKWIHVAPPTAANHASQTNGNNASHLLLYKWTPISQSGNNNNNDNNNGDKSSSNEDNSAVVAAVETSRKKFRYVPIAVLEEQNKEDAEKVEDEAKPTEANPPAGASSMRDGSDGKPDINDVPMEEAQASDKDQPTGQDLNETSLDLSLGLKGHDGDQDSNPKPEGQNRDGP